MQETLKCQEFLLVMDVFWVGRGVKLGLMIELVCTNVTLPLVKIFPTGQQIAVALTCPSYPASLYPKLSGPPHNPTIEGVMSGIAGGLQNPSLHHSLSPFWPVSLCPLNRALNILTSSRVKLPWEEKPQVEQYQFNRKKTFSKERHPILTISWYCVCTHM